jgi:hypothetical protein
MMAMKKFLIYSFLLVAILVTLFLVPVAKNTNFDEKALPIQLQTTGLVIAGSDAGYLDFLYFRREACGAAVLRLDPQTVEMIKRDGLDFFSDAIQGRGYPGNHYYHYESWLRTPAPQNWFGDGVVSVSFHCANISSELLRRIIKASLRPGGFFAVKEEGQLFVLPDEGMVVFAYSG